MSDVPIIRDGGSLSNRRLARAMGVSGRMIHGFREGTRTAACVHRRRGCPRAVRSPARRDVRGPSGRRARCRYAPGRRAA